MLKIIGFIFILFSLIITTSLFNGIELKELSYNNINIKKLYLKYDKKLTIEIPQLIITNEISQKQVKIETNFTIDYRDKLFEFNVTQFNIDNTDIFAQGIILLDTDTIDLSKRSEITLQNVNFQFDKKMKHITSNKVFVLFENNQLDLKFEKPYYDDVDLTNSKVSYNIDTNVLKLYLKSTSLLNSTIKNAILHYGIDIPITQQSGKNEISTNIFIPFSKGNFDIETNVKMLDGTLEAYEQTFDISKLSLNYDDFKLKGDLFLLNYKLKNLEIKDSQINYEVKFDKNIDANITTKKFTVAQDDKKLFFNNAIIKILNNKLNFTSKVTSEDENINVDINNTTNLNEKTTVGELQVNKLRYKNVIDLKRKKLPYKIVHQDDFILTNPTFALSYFKKNDSNATHTLIIKKPKKILNAFNFITTDNNSKKNAYVSITSQDLLDTTIEIKELNFNINSTYFDSDSNETKKFILPKFPKLNISYKDSEIGYDEYKISFDTLDIKTNDAILDLHLIKDSTTIDAQTENNSLVLKARNLTDKYTNKLINRNLFEDGYINLNIHGDDINLLYGDINFHTTTVKNVTLINSLLTFVNTTPAIVNPLLALPTLFRMAETGFDTTGYYMENAEGSFVYNLQSKKLNFYDSYTNGKMSNFKINSLIDYNTREVYANVDISFLKDFSNAISYIPIVGYVIMGEDGEFHTSVDITGTIDDPVIETHTVKEGSRGATSILKRIITLPMQPFNIQTTEEQKKDHDIRTEKLLNPKQD